MNKLLEAVDNVNLNRANKREITQISQSYFSHQKCSVEKIEPEDRTLRGGSGGGARPPVGGLGGKTPKYFRLSP